MEETKALAPRFDWQHSDSYNMSIQLSLDGLSFCVLDPVTNTFLALHDVRFEAPDPSFAKHEEFLMRNRTFQLHFNKVAVTIESPAFTLMPIALYDDDNIRQLLALTGINVRDDDKVLRNNIDLAGATTAFAVPNFLYFFLRTQFKDVDIYHITTPVVNSLLLKRQGEAGGEQPEGSVCAILNRESLTMVAACRGELRLCNRFYCRETTDYVYMVLFVLEQLGFDPQSTPIAICGDVTTLDPRVRELQRFARLAQIAPPPRFFNYGFAMTQEPQKFNTLFLLSLCA